MQVIREYCNCEHDIIAGVVVFTTLIRFKLRFKPTIDEMPSCRKAHDDFQVPIFAIVGLFRELLRLRVTL